MYTALVAKANVNEVMADPLTSAKGKGMLLSSTTMKCLLDVA
jgi:hypothetical protein